MIENEVQVQHVTAIPEDSGGSDKTSLRHTPHTLHPTQKEKNPKRPTPARLAAQTRRSYREKILQESRSAKDA